MRPLAPRSCVARAGLAMRLRPRFARFPLRGFRPPLLGSPRLGLRFSGRVGGGLRPAPLALCVGSPAPRRVSLARAPCAPALRVRSSAPAPALGALPSCLSAFRWCVLLCRSPRAALRCGECPLCSCRLLRFRFVCVLCDTPPRALFVRASRAMFAVVSSRLFVRGCPCVLYYPLARSSLIPCVPARPRPPSRSFLALLSARARSSRVRLLVPLRFTRAGRFD